MFKPYTFDKFNSFYYRRKNWQFDIKKIIPYGEYCWGHILSNIDDFVDNKTERDICPYYIRMNSIEGFCSLSDCDIDDGCKICGINRHSLYLDSLECIELVNCQFINHDLGIKEPIIIKPTIYNIRLIFNRLAEIYSYTTNTLYNSYSYDYSFEYTNGESRLRNNLAFETEDKYQIYVAMYIVTEFFSRFYHDITNEQVSLNDFKKHGRIIEV